MTSDSITLSLTVVILTYNEEKHLERCIKSLGKVAQRIIVVDSFSTDNTLSIAKKLKADIFQKKWINYADQFQWALDNTGIDTDWTMRMDADEFARPGLESEIFSVLSRLPFDTTGVHINRRQYFMDKWIKKGYYPLPLLRIWRTGSGYIEKKWMDEHIKLTHGNTLVLKNDIVDHNLNNLTWWITKHNSYATREAVDRLNREYKFLDNSYETTYVSGRKEKRYKSVYMSLPLFIRPFLYFFYRYIIQLGFLEGKPGLVWHILQGFWFQFLVDAKIYQIKHLSAKSKKTILEVLIEDFELKL